MHGFGFFILLHDIKYMNRNCIIVVMNNKYNITVKLQL